MTPLAHYLIAYQRKSMTLHVKSSTAFNETAILRSLKMEDHTSKIFNFMFFSYSHIFKVSEDDSPKTLKSAIFILNGYSVPIIMILFQSLNRNKRKILAEL